MKIVEIPKDYRRGEESWIPLVEKIVEAAKQGKAVEVTKEDLNERLFATARSSMAQQMLARGYNLHGRRTRDRTNAYAGVFWGEKR